MVNFLKRLFYRLPPVAPLLGAVLSHERNGVRHPIVYASLTLNAQERKAFFSYVLGLAVLFGTEKFRKNMAHQDFILETDKQPLSWLLLHPRRTFWRTQSLECSIHTLPTRLTRLNVV